MTRVQIFQALFPEYLLRWDEFWGVVCWINNPIIQSVAKAREDGSRPDAVRRANELLVEARLDGKSMGNPWEMRGSPWETII